jgi:tetratricopeptide (TPR) repeat protein
VVEQCRRLWAQRERLARLAPEAGPEREQVRADLLDLAVVWVHLESRLPATGPGRAPPLEVLREAETLFGPSCVLDQERRRHGLDREQEKAVPPRTAWEHYALGRVYLQAGDVTRALAQMERALELEPGALWPNFYRGCCARRLGRHQDAVVAFAVCAALAPDRACHWYNRGLAYLELGRLDEALRDHDRALRLDPDLVAAALSRGTLH